MADYSTYLRIEGTDSPDNSQTSHERSFVQEQHAIYDSCTNYFGATSATQAGAVRLVVESMQGRCTTKSSVKESTALLSGEKSIANAVSTDSVYESKKNKKAGVWLALFVMFYVFYLVLGSVAFEGMEVNSEIAEREDFREMRGRFLQKYSNVLGSAKLFLRGSQNMGEIVYIYIYKFLWNIYIFLRFYYFLCRCWHWRVHSAGDQVAGPWSVTAAQCHQWAELEFRSGVVLFQHCHYNNWLVYKQ